MGVYPCEVCHERYFGAQQTMYPAVVEGQYNFRQKTRMCPKCFESALISVSELLVDVADREHQPIIGCAQCLQAQAELALFVTVYASKADRQDYFGLLCRRCLDSPLTNALFGKPLHDLNGPMA